MFLLQLRQSLADEGHETFDAFANPGCYEDKGYDSGDPDIGHPDFDMPDGIYMDEDVPFQHDKVSRQSFCFIQFNFII